MNAYLKLFERVYSAFCKTSRAYSPSLKFDSAFFTCTFIPIPILANLLSVFQIIRVAFDESLKIGIMPVVLMIFAMVFNLIFFLPKKKYLKLSDEFANYTAPKKRRTTILAWFYIVGSVLLFFALLIGLKPS
jgi:hypothetical protein